MEGKTCVVRSLCPRVQLTIFSSLRMARCSVTLANKGDDSFMPHVYGDSITIERTLNKTGSGGYKIKNHEGKTVDAKKATLDAIRAFLIPPPLPTIADSLPLSQSTPSISRWTTR
jgi:hypothetical protein